MSNQQPQTIAAANILTGEKSFLSVQFAITGDAEIDAASAVMACFDAIFQNDGLSHTPDKIRVLRFLLNRFEDWTKEANRQREYNERLQQIGRVTTPPMTSPIGPGTLAQPGYVPNYTTSGKTLAQIFMEEKQVQNSKDSPLARALDELQRAARK